MWEPRRGEKRWEQDKEEGGKKREINGDMTDK
jgi:hypothetical protein